MTRSTVPLSVLTASAPVVDAVTIPGLVTAADSAGRTITGRVLLYGQTGHTSAGPARFTRGALKASDPRRIKLLVEHDVARVVGYGTTIVEDEQGITATFHVPAGAVGDEVLASAAAGLRDGLSVGVMFSAASRGADGVLDVTDAEWRETSIVAVPAYTGSVVTNVAASAQLTPPPAAAGGQVAPILTPAAPAAGAVVTPRPVDLSAAFQGMAAAYRAEGIPGLMRAALTDVVLPDGSTPAGQQQRDAMIPPQWAGELWQATNRGRRPIIDVITKRPLTSIRVTGTQRTYPAWGVDDYAGGKAAIPSPGDYAFGVTSVDAKRLAGGHDFDRVFLDFPADFGSGSFLESYFTDQTINYLEKTESKVAAQLLADAFDLGYAATVLDGLTTLAAYLGSRGANVDFVKVAPDLYGAALAITQAASPWLFNGSANLRDSTAQIADLTIKAEQSLPPATMLAGDARSATFYEWRNPPLRVEAINIPNGGVDLAVFGYWAEITNDPASVATLTVGEAPPVPPEGRAIKSKTS